jgi:RimJ/RimL family protein N-acetyltransferase
MHSVKSGIILLMKTALELPTEMEGVVLRELVTSADDEAYFAAIDVSREHLSQYGDTTSARYPTLGKVKESRALYSNRLRLGIWAEDDFVGTIDARPNEAKSEAEIGFWLRADATGNGYATIALKALTDHLLPDYKRILTEVHVDNDRSARVMRRAGFKLIGGVIRAWGPALIFERTND